MEKQEHIIVHESLEQRNRTLQTIGVIGMGNMGTAAIRGLIGSGMADAALILVSNRDAATSAERLAGISHENVRIGENNEAVVRESDIVFLSLKQQALKDELASWREKGISYEGKLLVSFAAGVRTETIARWMGVRDVAIVRVMPNTPTASGRGVLGWYCNDFVRKGQERTLRTILGSLGLEKSFEDEKKIDLITAISGSGPAYFYRLAESMVKFSKDNELSDEDARILVYETMIGAAHHIVVTGEDVEVLRKKITSKGGTTEAAMTSFEGNDFDDMISVAMDAAHKRAEELGNKFDTM